MYIVEKKLIKVMKFKQVYVYMYLNFMILLTPQFLIIEYLFVIYIVHIHCM